MPSVRSTDRFEISTVGSTENVLFIIKNSWPSFDAEPDGGAAYGPGDCLANDFQDTRAGQGLRIAVLIYGSGSAVGSAARVGDI